MNRRRPSQPCRFFAQGSCRKGNSCTYSHDSGARDFGQSTKRVSRSSNANTTDDEEFYKWRNAVPKSHYEVIPLRQGLGPFFQVAYQLVQVNAELRQQVIIRLASDGGLTRVKELVTQDYEHLPNNQRKLHAFESQILPFLQLLSHRDVRTSPVLEQHVVNIYNYVYGVGGQRLAPFLKFIAAIAPTAAVDDAIAANNEIASPLDTISAYLVTLFEINGQAALDITIHEIVKDLVKACTDLPLGTQKNFAKIQRQVDIGFSIPGVKGYKKRSGAATAVFHLHQEPPGGRHDNDYANICDIRILPTFAEIKSSVPEYLPTVDGHEDHLGGLDGLLDRNFRLLREDTVGQLRDAVASELDDLQLDDHFVVPDKKSKGVRTHAYRGVKLVEMKCEKRSGFQFVVEFQEPPQIRGKTQKEKALFWQQSRRLQEDALICVLDSEGTVIFCTVTANPSTRLGSEDQDQLNPPAPHIYQAADGLGFAYVALSLVSRDEHDLSELLDCVLGDLTNCSLVEFPGVLLPAFQPTLKALQRMKRDSEIPFQETLAPTHKTSSRQEVLLDPPAYSLERNFRFNLKCLMKGGSDLWLSPRGEFNTEKLKASSTLDDKQAIALIHGLTTELALIQGPPGTGKSYVGIAMIKVLLDNTHRGHHRLRAQRPDIGPVICVCYTNHALDQLLEELHSSGVTQIIRIGSQSKSEVLKPLNLREVSGRMDKTKQEKTMHWTLMKNMEKAQEEIRASIDRIHTSNSPASVEEYLEFYEAQHYLELFGRDDDDGFQKVRYTSGSRGIIYSWLKAGVARSGIRSLAVLRDAPLHTMSQVERHVLHSYWVSGIAKTRKQSLLNALLSYESSKLDFEKLREELDLRCLQEASVVGLTTTGLARNLDLIRRCGAKVIVGEEAGEILEAHTLTAFLPSVEHAILIGDHLQLRPQIQNYELQRENPRGKQYSLDVSLFERLVAPADGTLCVCVPFTTLETQRRMYPSISEIIRQYLYPTLKDHTSVSDYPEVPGMKKRLFWLDHKEPEASAGADHISTTSHSNPHELAMVAALVSHLVRQGVYKPGEIALLTPYLGQLRKLRQRLSSTFEIAVSDRDEDALEIAGLEEEEATPKTSRSTLLHALRIATVDNFQGEEAKVVIISLVRSNNERKCGFLRTSNRINVLLSRAKHAMYLIGNADTYSTVPMWKNTIRILQDGENFGAKLELRCPRHMDDLILVAQPDDFAVLSPEGGCKRRCGLRLQCGHVCAQRCHAGFLHDSVHCLEECPRSLKGCDHVCPLPCGDACKPCGVKLHLQGDDQKLPCGHRVETLTCSQSQNRDTVICKVTVPQMVPGCNHTVEVRCGVDVSDKKYICQAICGAALPCGHVCTKLCFICRPRSDDATIGINHGQCLQRCGRPYTTCSHSCEAACHQEEPCPLCTAPCDVSCSHSKCQQPCHEACIPCAKETCASRCPHSACLLPCSAPCSWLPCSKRCEESLTCGHQCPSICGETCPPSTLCQICCTAKVKEVCADFIMLDTYGEVDLEENPCIFPNCGHIMTLNSMDGHMAMKDHYVFDENGAITKIKNNAAPFSQEELKACPSCRGSLRNIARYGRIIRRALLDAATKKFIISSNKTYVQLAQEFAVEQENLSATQDDFDRSTPELQQECLLTSTRIKVIGAIPSKIRLGRYRRMLNLRKNMAAFADQVAVDEQPFTKMYNHVQNARRRHGREVAIELDSKVIQTRGHILATTLLLKCELTIITDFLALRRNALTLPTTGALSVNLSAYRKACDELINRARRAQQIRQLTEAHTFWAHSAALERVFAGDDIEQAAALKNEAAVHLTSARSQCLQNPGSTAGLEASIEAVKLMLRDGIFYTQVTNEEMRQVVAAMATEFSGTGHWYYCENNHPFTVGECGMPMETARCPQCGAPVGGHNHQAVAGVRHATDLEHDFVNLRI
ncbi:hypothetical protein GQ44DRAFT_792364 [Phaeosphaeriaceae sp. PMI808]|nr:hypothetical protein GQ44DRAFT_792364 [Phaeosphaeriaceae sp. PMI808]